MAYSEITSHFLKTITNQFKGEFTREHKISSGTSLTRIFAMGE